MSATPKTITVVGGNLFALAAKHLGNAQDWNRIAVLNGLTDPFLPPEAVTLTLPAPDPGLSNGGILGAP